MPRLPATIGRYSVLEPLGKGGMGTVYLATDPRLGRTVAIKLLSVADDEALSDELRERFAREARSAASLTHRNIVIIYDIGEEDGRPFIAMEYLPGETLAELIKRRANLPLSRKLEMMVELCEGLGHAHRSGLIHRDIKPANLMITSDGSLKILDFGLARLADSDTRLTRVGTLMGTPYYMSPEQIEGSNVDHRSDIFAVGAVMYELLTYQKAFPGEAPHNVLHKIMHAEAEPIRKLLPDIDAALEQIVHRNLQRDPARRYQDLAALAADLESIRERTREAGELATDAMPAIDSDKRRDGAPASTKGSTTDSAVRTGIDSVDERRRALIEERRRSQVEAHLKQASAHLLSGALQEAIDECEHVLVYSSEDPRALEMLRLAHRGLEDRQVAQWLTEAQAELSRGDLTSAQLHIEQSLRSRPDSSEAQRLEVELRERRREAERAAERARAVRLALERARANLEDGSLDAALRCASEALAHDPASTDARGLRQQILAAIAERREREEQEQRAYDAVVQARQRSAGGDLDAALAMLKGFTPQHQVIAKAIGEIEEEIRERDRQRAEEEARRQREQEEQQRREELARQARERGEAKRRKAEEAKRLQEEEARRRREAEEKERQTRVEAHKQAARVSIEHGRFDDAAAAIAQVRRLAPSDRDVAELTSALAKARTAAEEEARRRDQADADARDAEACLGRNELTAALRLAAAVLAAVPNHSLALQVQKRAQAGIEAKKREDALRQDAERARQAEHNAREAERQRQERETEQQRLAHEAEKQRQAREAERQRQEREAEEQHRREREREAHEEEQRRRAWEAEQERQSAPQPAEATIKPAPPPAPMPVPAPRLSWNARVRGIAVLAVLLALGGAVWQALGGPEPPPPRVAPKLATWEVELKAAQNALSRNDSRSALTQLQAILRADPKFTPAIDLVIKIISAKQDRVDRARADAGAKAASDEQSYKDAAQSEAAANKATGDAVARFDLLDTAERKYSEAASAALSVDEIAQRAADAYRRGETDSAIQTYADGLARFPRNTGLSNGLAGIVNNERKSASDARTRAQSAGKSQTNPFRAGVQRQQQADSMIGRARDAEQARTYIAATRLFKEALDAPTPPPTPTATPALTPAPRATATPVVPRPDPLAAAREALQRAQNALARNDLQAAEQEAQSALRGGLKDEATSLLNDINKRRSDESARTLRQRVDALRSEASRLTGQARVRKLEEAFSLDSTRKDVGAELDAARKEAEKETNLAAIKKTLRDYETASGRLNIDEIIAVAPFHDRAQLTAAFKNYSSYSLTIAEGDPAIEADMANVEARITRQIKLKAGSAPRATPDRVRIFLERRGGKWVITNIK